MQTLTEILSGLQASTDELITWLATQDNDGFERGPEGKWDTSQHLDHLRKADAMLTKAMKTPKFILRYKFGSPNRPLRTYDEIVEKYQSKVGEFQGVTLEASKGEKYLSSQKEVQLERFQMQVSKLVKASAKWSDKQLDSILIPHPLLGRMMAREILQWCIYHHYHHLNTLKANY